MHLPPFGDDFSSWRFRAGPASLGSEYWWLNRPLNHPLLLCQPPLAANHHLLRVPPALPTLVAQVGVEIRQAVKIVVGDVDHHVARAKQHKLTVSLHHP